MASIRHKAFSGSIHISVLDFLSVRETTSSSLSYSIFLFCLCFSPLLNNHYNFYPRIWFDMSDKQVLMIKVYKENLSEFEKQMFKIRLYKLFFVKPICLCAVWFYKCDYIINSAFQVPVMYEDKHVMCFLIVSLCTFCIVRNTTKAVSHVTARGPLLVLW